MSGQWINLNGELLESNKPVFNFNNRAFRYGDGLFESVRVINHSPMFFNEHFTRLKKGMQLLQMHERLNFNLENLLRLINELLVKNKCPNARLRLTVFRENGGLYSPINNSTSFLIETEILN